MKFDSRLVSGLGLSRSAFSRPSDLSSDEKIQIAKALPELDDQLSVWLGRLLTEDPDRNVRCEVAITLGYLGYRAAARLHDRIARRATRYLEKLAGDPSWEVRRNVTIGALQYGAESVLPIVHRLLKDDESEVRDSARYCYQGLSSLYPNAAAKLVIEHHPLSIEPTSGKIFLSHTSPSRPALGRFWKPISGLNVGLPLIEHLDIQEFVRKGNVATFPDESAALLDVVLSGGSDSASSGGAAGAAGIGGGASGPRLPNEPPSGPPSGGGEPPLPGSGGEGRQPEYVDLGEGARYVNSWFLGHPNPIQPLVFGREYELGIEIGPQLREGSFTAGDPKFKAPPFGDQESLEITVGVISDDFRVLDKTAKRMKLPKDRTKRSDPVTFILVVFAAALVCLFVLARQAPEVQWQRYIYLYGGVEAIAFAAAGFLFGREVNRQRAENAEANADTKTEEAKRAGQGEAAANQKGQDLTKAILAKLTPSTADALYGSLGKSNAEAVQTLARSQLQELADIATGLFPQ